MSRNLLVGLIVVLLALGGFMVVQSQSKTEAPTSTAPQTQDQTTESSVTHESVSESDDSMMKKEDNVVILTSTGFEPKTITVKVGEEVVWKNQSGETATVDSAVHPTHRVYPRLNLGNFEDGEEHRLVFDKAGRYNYHDHLNPSRFGTVVVE